MAKMAWVFPSGRQILGDPDARHFNVTQGHAVSDDLKTWTHLGTTFAPADGLHGMTKQHGLVCGAG